MLYVLIFILFIIALVITSYLGLFLYRAFSGYKPSKYYGSKNMKNNRFYFDKFLTPNKCVEADNFDLKCLFKSNLLVGKQCFGLVPKTLTPKVEDRVYDGVKITQIGHATVLIQVDGVNILTDPLFSESVGFGPFAKKRSVEPALKIEELPKIDYVFISHNHIDHLDKKSILQLDKIHSPVFLTFLGNEYILEKDFMVSSKVLAFDLYDRYRTTKNNNVVLEFLPALHFSGTFKYRKNAMLWGSLAVRNLNGAIYYASDTEYTDEFFNHLKNHLGYIEAAILPVKVSTKKIENAPQSGQIELEDFLSAVSVLNPSKCLTMQCGVFQFGDRDVAFNDFIKSFNAVCGNKEIRTKIVLQHVGSETVIDHKTQ